jgi:preprotein translocase subunit SecA
MTVPDRIYRSEMGKFKQIIKEIKALHTKGQPVLIGTNSIEKNEVLSELLKKAKLPHQMLNAKNNEREATIVAKAGRKGAITLATNIAGRGTDIVLDDEAKKLGGLFVIGTERNESRRVDNQFRGRSGRQGDPGATQFYVSTEDDLMRVFGGERIGSIMNRLGVDDETPIENRVISRSLEGAQKKVEGYHYDARKDVVKFDDVMNRHRKAIYTMRREILMQTDIQKRIKLYIEDEAKAIASSPELMSDKLQDIVTEAFPLDDAALDRLFDANADKFAETLTAEAMELYAAQEEAFSTEIMRKVERDIYLQVLDNLWMQHLENMHHLREGIYWMSVGQRDPLVEYRRQAQIIFDAMQNTMRHEVIRSLFHAQPAHLEEHVETELTKAARNSVDNADRITEAEEFHEVDFTPQRVEAAAQKKTTEARKKARKQERKRKTVAKRRK